MSFSSTPVVGDRVAVIDVGSRSLQLVIYDQFGPAPILLHREKVVAVLGKNLSKTGMLHQAGMELAAFNLNRFVQLVRDLKVNYCAIVATAALRDAKNGEDYVRSIEELCQAKVQILRGEEEALYSARSLQWSFLNPEGIMGDLGGGSLELVRLAKGEIKEKVSLPVGPLRIEDTFSKSPQEAQALLKKAYGNLPWIETPKALYLVGGGWRTLANYHMEKTRYPIPISHGYHLTPEETRELCLKIIKASPKELSSWSRATAGRKMTLPLAALILKELLTVVTPEKVVFTSYGLREGFLMSQLPEALQREDPFLWAAAEWNKRSSRLPAFASVLYTWVAPLMPQEAALERLIHGACLLSDVVWRDHHNFQAEIMFERALSLPFVALSHEDRAFLALTLYLRYGGKMNEISSPKVLSLLQESQILTARLIGAAMHLAYTLSAGSYEILKTTRFVMKGDDLDLITDADSRLFEGYEVQKRFQKLLSVFKMQGSV